MNTASTSLPESVQSSFLRLQAVAEELNTASDILGKLIGRIDETLKKLNLGLTVWVTVQSWDDCYLGGSSYGSNEVGYAKINGRWGIGLKTVTGNLQHPDGSDGDEEERWLFNDAPRPQRLEAIGQLSKVLEKLGDAASEMTSRIHSKLEEVSAIVNVINPPQLLPPLHPRPLTGVNKPSEVK